MARYIIVFLIGFGVGFFASETTHANIIKCGLKPVLPLGCHATRCICVNDDCFWLVECEND